MFGLSLGLGSFVNDIGKLSTIEPVSEGTIINKLFSISSSGTTTQVNIHIARHDDRKKPTDPNTVLLQFHGNLVLPYLIPRMVAVLSPKVKSIAAQIAGNLDLVNVRRITSAKIP